MGDDSATGVTVPGHRTPTHRSPRPELTMSSFTTPDDVLYVNELMRGRLWVRACVLFALGGIVSALVFESPGMTARVVLIASSSVLLGAASVGVWVLRDDGRYGAGLAAVFGYTSLLAAVPGLYFFGWFSPITVLIALGAVIYAMGHTTRAVISLAVAAIGAHTALGLLTIFEVVPDRALSTIRDSGIATQLACLSICEALLGVAFVVGRRLRGQALVGVESYGLVVRESARRQALLEEAVDDLKRIRRVGDPGRYTGLTLGSYELGVVLGRGAMGEVYDSTHVTTGEAAAVKVIARWGETHERALNRFRREIALAASVDSPHVVRVLEHSEEGADLLYLTMERLHGTSLAEQLRSVKRPPLRDILEMLRQVSRGAAAAHARGIVHRDLTPHNLFQHREGEQRVWKILDFGVSRLAEAKGTLTGDAIVGTPNYMSPEQATGSDVDQRADLFALGCIAYRCLTGRPAFRGQSMADVLYRVVHDAPTRPSRLAPLPHEVDLVLAICLAKKPEDRFATADELADALDRSCRATIDPYAKDHAERVLIAHPWGE